MMSFEALVTKYGNNLKKFRTTQFKSHLKLKTSVTFYLTVVIPKEGNMDVQTIVNLINSLFSLITTQELYFSNANRNS